jgi:hypothetical protein
MSAAELTVLRTPSLWMTKRIWPDRIEDYSRAKKFDVQTVSVAGGLDGLRPVLERLADDPRAVVIRGSLIDGTRTKGVRRLLHVDRKTGEEPVFEEHPREWVALDIEGIARPDDLPAADLLGCARLAVEHLPAAFREARCLVQASGSHGIKPDIRLRLWFWLDRPTTGAELTRWLADTPADPAVFRPVQVTYTSRPIFMDGAVDPLPIRLAELPGAPCVTVPSLEALAPPVKPPRPSPKRRETAPPGQPAEPRQPASDAAIEAFITRCLNGVRRAREGHKHTVLFNMGRLLGGIRDQAGFTTADAVQWLLGALPGTVQDWRAAEETATQGVEIGALEPVELPPEPRTAANSLLAAFYPAPTEDRDTAKARQDAALIAHMVEGARIVRARLELRSRRAEKIAAGGGELALTPHEKGWITRRLHREIAEREGWGRRLPLPPMRMFSGVQGSGKTTVARQFAAALPNTGGSPDLTTWITEPTFEKATEEFEAYQAEAGPDTPPAMLIRGRERFDPHRPGHFMCDRNRAARRLSEANLPVPELLCKGCEFNGGCGDHRQRAEARALVDAGKGARFFMAGAYAFLRSPAPAPDHAILDESLLRQAVDVRTVAIEDLAGLSVPNTDTTSGDTTTTLRAIIEAFTTPHPTTPERVAAGDERIVPRPLASLRHAGIDRAALGYLAKAVQADLDRQTPAINASMTDAEIEEALEWGNRRHLRNLLALVKALSRELDLPREEATGVWPTTSRDGRAALSIAKVRRPRGLRHATVTVLDGTGRLDLARKVYGPRLEETRIQFERRAHVIGTRGRNYSKVSITAEDRNGNAINNRVASAAKLRGEIATIFSRLPAGSAVCATKRVEEMVFDSGAVPSDTPTMHFGKLRGLNTWEHCPGALIIGAENIALADVEALARAFLASDPVPFVSMDHAAPAGWRYEHQWPYRATRMRRMRDGSTSAVEVPVHPDPRVQDVLELIREDELLQAIDRPRPVWHPRQYALLNDLCLDVTYDEVHSHRHLVAGGNPVQRAVLATGIVPHTPADLHRAHPTIFRTAKAAEHALKNYPITALQNSIWDLGGVSYRRLGQRGPEAKATIDRSRYPDDGERTTAAWTAAVGPLQSFQGVAVQSVGIFPTSGLAAAAATWLAPAPRQPGAGAAPPSLMVHGPPDG